MRGRRTSEICPPALYSPECVEGGFSEVRLDEFSEVSHLAHKKSQQVFCKRDARTLKVQREFIAIVVM